MELKIFDVEKEQESSDWEVWTGSTYIFMGKDYQDEIEDAQKLLDAGAKAQYYAHEYEWVDQNWDKKVEIKSINADQYNYGLEFEETQNLLETIKYLEEYFDFPEYSGNDVRMGWFLTMGDSLVLIKDSDWSQPYIANMEDRERVRELIGIDPDMMHNNYGERATMSEIDYFIDFN